MSKCLDTEKAIELVGSLGSEIYPRDIFPALSTRDYANMKQVEEMFPHLIARIDTAACHRAFEIAAKRLREMEEE